MNFDSRLKLLFLKLPLAISLASLAMAQTSAVTIVNAANYRPIVAPDSIVSLWGNNLAPTLVSANVNNQGSTVTLPTTLGNIKLSVTDSTKTASTPALYIVSPGQINLVLPNIAVGAANLTFVSGVNASGPLLLSNVSPGIFTADGSGSGVPAAQVLRVTAAGQGTLESPIQSSNSVYAPSPISLTNSPGDVVYGNFRTW